MSNLKFNTTNIHDLINQMTVGFDSVFDNVKTSNGNFPPHNIIKSDNNQYRIEFALAGFSKDDVEVSVEDGMMTIKGESPETKVESDQYLHRGIAARSFSKSFSLDKDLEVTGGTMDNGILVINLERIIPEHKKPRLVKLK